jgi:hypothetical protein
MNNYFKKTIFAIINVVKNFGESLRSGFQFVVNLVTYSFKKNVVVVKEFKNKILITISNLKVLETLKQLPRWAERIARWYLFRENFYIHDAIARLLLRNDVPLALKAVEGPMHIATFYITFFFLMYDFLNPVFIDAFINSGVPTDNMADYITAFEYTHATPGQLEQLAAGDSSLLTEDQLERFNKRYEIYNNSQKIVKPEWHSVRWDIILVAVITVAILSQ